MALRRIRNEIKEMKDDPPPRCSAQPIGQDLFNWTGTIKGPIGTPYENGTFRLNIVLPDNYPYSPPGVNFITQVYHPNISDGHICLDILSSNWAPALTIGKVLLSISSLLSDPNPFDPLDSRIACEYQHNREQFNRKARQWTQKYAA